MSLVPQNLLKNQSDSLLHPRPGKSEVRHFHPNLIIKCSTPHRSKPVRESGHQESRDSEGSQRDEITQISLWLASYFQVLLLCLLSLPLPIFLSWEDTLLLHGKLSISAHFNTETSLKPS